MKSYKIGLVITAFALSVSCKKVSENVTGAGHDTLEKRSSGARAAVSSCDEIGYTSPIVDTFSADNKLPDGPINPATGVNEADIALKNYERIQWCLSKYKKAHLNSGVFIINKILQVEDAELISANGDWPTIRLNDTIDNAVVRVHNNCRVAFLTLDANKKILLKGNASVVEVTGYGNQVDNNWIMGGGSVLFKTDPGNIAGVYIMCGDNNLVWNNKIRNNDHGVIITKPKGAEAPLNNVVKENDIWYNRSDGISLVTYGQVFNNKIYLNGWDCQNGGTGSAIPGAGIYAERNHDGALINSNTIYDNNGHNIDLWDIQNFSIVHNTVYNPGNKYFPESDYSEVPAGGAFAVSIVDASDCVIDSNDIRNENRPWNKIIVPGQWWGNDINRFFSEYASDTTYSDLPFGGNSLIAFCLAETRCNRPDLTPAYVINQTRHNTIRGNIFIASPNGIGYFATRNTGFDADFSWSAATTNYYTLNNPNGSTVGSVRCGGNWYAANQVDANTDDFQHQPPSSSWSGNDNRNFYNAACPISQ